MLADFQPFYSTAACSQRVSTFYLYTNAYSTSPGTIALGSEATELSNYKSTNLLYKNTDAIIGSLIRVFAYGYNVSSPGTIALGNDRSISYYATTHFVWSTVHHLIVSDIILTQLAQPNGRVR